jgi:hypothetical protein
VAALDSTNRAIPVFCASWVADQVADWKFRRGTEQIYATDNTVLALSSWEKRRSAAHLLRLVHELGESPSPFSGRAFRYSERAARYRPGTLFLLQPLDCGLSFQARLRISYPHNSESSFSLLGLDPQQVSRPYFLRNASRWRQFPIFVLQDPLAHGARADALPQLPPKRRLWPPWAVRSPVGPLFFTNLAEVLSF